LCNSQGKTQAHISSLSERERGSDVVCAARNVKRTDFSTKKKLVSATLARGANQGGLKGGRGLQEEGEAPLSLEDSPPPYRNPPGKVVAGTKKFGLEQ